MKDVQHYDTRQGYGVTVITDDHDDRDGHLMRLRAKVYIDSYPEQSHAKAELWTRSGWVEVYTLEPSTSSKHAFGAPSYASHDDDAKRTAVAAIATKVLQQAAWVADGKVYVDF